jgi:histone H3/H4
MGIVAKICAEMAGRKYVKRKDVEHVRMMAGRFGVFDL